MMDFSNPNQMWMPQGYDPYGDMNDDERMKTALLQAVTFVGMIIAMFLILLLCGSCTTTKVVEVERVRTDTTYITKQQRDSIYVRDSTWVSQTQQGDTVRITIDRWHTEWRDRWRTDTVYHSRTDSVPLPYPVITKVPAELTWWQRFRISMANVVMYTVVLLGIVYIGRRHISKLTS